MPAYTMPASATGAFRRLSRPEVAARPDGEVILPRAAGRIDGIHVHRSRVDLRDVWRRDHHLAAYGDHAAGT